MIVWLQLLSTPGTLVLAIANPILLTFVTVLNGALSLSYLGMTGKHSFKLLSRPASGLLAFALVFLLLHSFLIKTEDGGPFFVGRMFVLLLCAYFPILEWGKLDEETKHRMRLLFFGGMFLAGVYFFFKILFNHWDQKLFMSFTGIVKEMKAHYGNRPAVIFVLWIWPVLLGFRLLLLPKSRWIYGSVTLLFLMFVIGGILQTASETAKLALLVEHCVCESGVPHVHTGVADGISYASGCTPCVLVVLCECPLSSGQFRRVSPCSASWKFALLRHEL